MPSLGHPQLGGSVAAKRGKNPGRHLISASIVQIDLKWLPVIWNTQRFASGDCCFPEARPDGSRGRGIKRKPVQARHVVGLENLRPGSTCSTSGRPVRRTRSCAFAR